MISGTYTSQGNKGLMAEGGSGRVAALRETIKSVGGTLDSMYWGFGSEDYYIFADLPNNVAAAAVSLIVSASGSVGLQTTVLLTAEDIDAAVKLKPTFRAPGA